MSSKNSWRYTSKNAWPFDRRVCHDNSVNGNSAIWPLRGLIPLSFITSFERICCKTVRFGWAVMLLIIYYPPFMVQIDTACKREMIIKSG